MTDYETKPKPRRGKSEENLQPAMPIVKRDFVDPDGIPQRVLLPENETDMKAGIPVSLDLSPLYGHMPAAFQRALAQALHAQGLVEAADFLKPGASQRFSAALRSVLQHDFLSVQALAHKEIHPNA